MSESHIVRRSSTDRRTGKTDWDRLDRMDDAEIEAAVASDPDAVPILDQAWFENAELVRPGKRLISLRLDAAVIDYFRGTGKNYQTRINAVLSAYVAHQKSGAK
ncbi:MAG: BrnA antitoxin family protein [Rhodospirillaceae bacterium]